MFLPKDTAKTIFYHVDYEKLKKEGYELLLFDIDGTCVTDNVPVDVRCIEFFENLRKMGFKYGVISNNYRDRVINFAYGIDADVYKYEACKPSPKKFIEACDDLGIDTSKAVFFGDQLATDILGANRAGIKSVVVDHFPYDILIGVALKRYIEFPFILASKIYNHIIKGYKNCLCSKKISKSDSEKQKYYAPVLKRQKEYAKTIAYMVRSQYKNIVSGIGTCCATLIVNNIEELQGDIKAISNLLNNDKYKSKLNFIELRIDKFLMDTIEEGRTITSAIEELIGFLIKNHNYFTNLESIRFIITLRTKEYGGYFKKDKYDEAIDIIYTLLSSNSHLKKIITYVDMELDFSKDSETISRRFELVKKIKNAGYYNILSCYAGAKIDINLSAKEFYDKVYSAVVKAGFNIDEMNTIKLNFYCNTLASEEKFISEILEFQSHNDVKNFSFLLSGCEGLETRKNPKIFKNILNFYSVNNKNIESQISFKEFVDGLK